MTRIDLAAGPRFPTVGAVDENLTAPGKLNLREGAQLVASGLAE